MEVAVRGTEVTIIGNDIIGFEQNNLVNDLVGSVDTEEGWEFFLKVEMTKTLQHNIIPIKREGGIIFVTLTADMMPVEGRYIGQFEMRNGAKVSNTDTFEFWVKNSINLNKVWTPIPTTFSELMNNVLILQQHPPVPGNQGYWMIWNVELEQYEQSENPLPAISEGVAGPYFTPAVSQNGELSWTNNGNLENPEAVNIKGPEGPQGPQGEKGETGSTGPQGPAGEKGEKGANGKDGPQGVPGPVGPVGPAGKDGIGLPIVTEADNGKVACVENGVWTVKLLSEIQS